MDTDDKKPADTRVPNLQLQLDDEIAQGRYTNFAIVNHSPTEFVLDFVFIQPQQPRGKVLSRLITSPVHAKRLMAALGENIARYEQRFGPIVVPSGKVSEPLVH